MVNGDRNFGEHQRCRSGSIWSGLKTYGHEILNGSSFYLPAWAVLQVRVWQPIRTAMMDAKNKTNILQGSINILYYKGHSISKVPYF